MNKQTVQAFVFDLFKRILIKIILNALRGLLILLGYLTTLSITLLELCLLWLDRLAFFLGFTLLRKNESQNESNTPIFSEGEIDIMAMRLPKGVVTIQAIADHYGISARQARKIREAIDNKVNVNNYSVA